MNNTIGNFIHKVKDQVFGGHEKTEENGSGINIKDTFDKTDGEGPSIGKLTTAAGVGTVLGISLANKSELSEHDKRISNLEKVVGEMRDGNSPDSATPPKDMGRQLSSLVNGEKSGEKPAASTAKKHHQVEKSSSEGFWARLKGSSEDQGSSDFTAGYAKECLQQYTGYTDDTKESLFKYAMEQIRDNKNSTSTEKRLAKYMLERQDDFDYHAKYVCNNSYVYSEDKRTFAKWRSNVGETALTFFSKPENMEGSFGKVMMKFEKQITDAGRASNCYKTNNEPNVSFYLAIQEIADSSLSTPYEKTLCKAFSGVCSDYNSTKGDEFRNCFKDCILVATEESNPIKDMASLAREYNENNSIQVYDEVFKAISKSSEADQDDKALAKKGDSIGYQGYSMHESDIIKDKEKIFGEIYRRHQIEGINSNSPDREGDIYSRSNAARIDPMG